MIDRFTKDIRKYFAYARYSAWSDLKAEVASSYLNWLWWILDPLMFMLVYTFIAGVVFNSRVDYFPLFVFIGLTLWDFFSKNVQGSVKMMRLNVGIISKVYIPKYILLLQRVMVNAFKMLICWGLIVIMMIIYRVPVTFNILYLIPVLIEITLLSFGIGCLVMHFGVFVDDLYNVVQIVLRLMFYMSGIFYSIEDKVEDPLRTIMISVNPASMLINSARKCVLYSSAPYRKLMLIWGVVSVLVCWLGVHVVYKYENSYVKVM